ncbi:hypothetical protein [Dictyobacter formicarum]|uniref:Uncharacterized protein n=1 Tax=Dictyobacter formicarum TaxID=2778368 RepID=A0ABQ3VG19_9CHLR|nr:hypothetical protein [Dictyobacter formicarum]GHO84651.1 hypothetical protein KSZ_26570 [Dictyobacter formicarum]
MSLKDPGARILYLVMLCSLLVVIAASILHQIGLLFFLMFIGYGILMLLLGGPLIFEGVKELRAARKNGEKVAWQSNRHFLKGLSLVFPFAFLSITSASRPSVFFQWSNLGIIFDIIGYVVAIVFLFPALVLLFVFYIGTMRYILNTPHPYAQYIQNAFAEEQSSDE